MIQSIILFFEVYRWILIGRVLLSWLPEFQDHPVAEFLRQLADPYLDLFRRIIPPVGGTLDLSPIIAFFALYFLETLLTRALV